MDNIKSLHWLLVISLGAFALVRPLARIVEDQKNLDYPAAIPVLITLAITAVWVAVVGLSRNPEPVLTLVFAGLTYGVLSIILSGILSPILNGELQGPLAMPIAIIPVLIVNALWGLIAGALALLLQRVRGVRNTSQAGQPIPWTDHDQHTV